MREHCLKSNLLQLSHSMFCKNVARLAVARGCHTWIRSLATAKQATFLQKILWESFSKFDFKQCSLKKSLKILIFQQEYMKMCFHSNRVSWGINHSNGCYQYENYTPTPHMYTNMRQKYSKSSLFHFLTTIVQWMDGPTDKASYRVACLTDGRADKAGSRVA